MKSSLSFFLFALSCTASILKMPRVSYFLLSLYTFSALVEGRSAIKSSPQSFRLELQQKRTQELRQWKKRAGSSIQNISSQDVSDCDGLGVLRANRDKDFWFAEVDVGNSTKLSLLIDTGSGDVIINPGLYVPSSVATPLNASFSNSYGTTNSDGTGTTVVSWLLSNLICFLTKYLKVTGALYRDTINYGGLVVDHLIGNATSNSPLPRDGIIGFSGAMFSQFDQNISKPYFHSLCEQEVVSECRFGLALTKNKTGTQVLGELATDLFAGNLTIAPIITEWVTAGDLTIENKAFAKDLIIELDSGTATVVG